LSYSVSLFTLRVLLARSPGPTLLPYTTLFRSGEVHAGSPGRPAHEQTEPHSAEAAPSPQAGYQGRLKCDLFSARDLNRSVFYTSDRKSTRLNSSHVKISYAVFCLKKKKNRDIT